MRRSNRFGFGTIGASEGRSDRSTSMPSFLNSEATSKQPTSRGRMQSRYYRGKRQSIQSQPNASFAPVTECSQILFRDPALPFDGANSHTQSRQADRSARTNRQDHKDPNPENR
jgi:hypothetical protein